MDIRWVSFEDLNPSVYNPRVNLQPGDKELEKLRRSIEEFGLVELLVWNEQTGNLVSGHQRLKILQTAGESGTSCVVVNLDATREKALNIALNKISGDWDLPKLRDLLEELDGNDFDIELTGFDAHELEQFMTDSGATEEEEPSDDEFDFDASVEEVKEPITRP